MNALLLTARKRFRLVQRPDPVPEHPAEVLVRVKAVGICGSDVHYYLRGSTGSGRPEYPFIIGHECSGETVAVGRRGRPLKPGQKVFIEPNIPCRTCDMCRRGSFNWCRNPKFLGYPGQMDGGLREFVVMPRENLIPFKSALSFEEALMAEPLSVALYALSLSRGLRIRTAAVLGCGSIGLCLMKAAHTLRRGWKIFATDIVGERRILGQKNGADRVFDGSRKEVTGQIVEATDGSGVDAVFECAGTASTLRQALEILKPGGTLFVIGIPSVPILKFDSDIFRKKGLTVTCIRRQNGQAVGALRLIEDGLIGVKDIIGPVFGLGEAGEAFDLKINRPGVTVKPIIKI